MSAIVNNDELIAHPQYWYIKFSPFIGYTPRNAVEKEIVSKTNFLNIQCPLSTQSGRSKKEATIYRFRVISILESISF